MKVDFRTQLLDFKNKPIPMRDEDQETGRLVIVPGTYQTAMDVVLMALGSADEKIDGREKVKRAKLALAVASETQPIELKVEDATKIKEIVAKTMPPLQVMRVEDIIDAAFASEPLKLVEGD